MLQQTRVAAAIPYYERFLARFPTVRSLAAAREGEVLRLWSGLGYYSRARNLHRAAKKIVSCFGGRFPSTLEEALSLPGIGRYTAAAVLSIAHGEPFAVLDGNVARVLARLGTIRGDLRAPARWAQLQGEAERLLAPRTSGDWNQAMMELGATVCTPLQPDCGVCPLARYCRARALRLTAVIPRKRKKRAPVRIEIAAAILLDPAGRTLLVKPSSAGDLSPLFSRLWHFPAVVVRRNTRAELSSHLRGLLRLSRSARLRLTPLLAARHAVTFREITLSPYLFRVPRLPRHPRSRHVRLDDLARLPVSNATRKLAAAARVEQDVA